MSRKKYRVYLKWQGAELHRAKDKRLNRSLLRALSHSMKTHFHETVESGKFGLDFFAIQIEQEVPAQSHQGSPQDDSGYHQEAWQLSWI